MQMQMTMNWLQITYTILLIFLNLAANAHSEVIGSFAFFHITYLNIFSLRKCCPFLLQFPIQKQTLTINQRDLSRTPLFCTRQKR